MTIRATMPSVCEIAEFLDDELDIGGIPDYPNALNGLQVAGGGKVGRIAAAVDASLPVVESAADAGAKLLLVHHGMFWNGLQRVTGSQHAKLKICIEMQMAIYSAHIPLDVHGELGNNILLARALGMENPQPFFDWKGIQLGLRGRMDISTAELRNRLSAALGGGPVNFCPGGGDQAGEVGIITGGAGSEVAAIAECGIDTFITGEGPHWSYTMAEELRMNVLYGGHYATETFGVKALAEHLSLRYRVPWIFIDHPTGL
jgi:dinuclear metal center YbgI/SA1388 family protein